MPKLKSRAQKYYIFLKKKRGEIKKIVIGRLLLPFDNDTIYEKVLSLKS